MKEQIPFLNSPQISGLGIGEKDEENVRMNHRMERIEQQIEESVRTKQQIGEPVKKGVLRTADAILKCHRSGNRVCLIGNGGSAADAQHFSCELVGRFLSEREPLDCLALTTNSSTLTALMNDYPPEELFSRQVRASMKSGDVLLAISTSGNSTNIVKAVQVAKKRGVFVIGMTGQGGGKLADLCDLLLDVPSTQTPRVQETHILLIHLICEFVEEGMTGKE